jgi:hypothetical protein
MMYDMNLDRVMSVLLVYNYSVLFVFLVDFSVSDSDSVSVVSVIEGRD